MVNIMVREQSITRWQKYSQRATYHKMANIIVREQPITRWQIL